MLFTTGHKWRRGESKEVGPDATDWPQSSRVIGRQDDGGFAGECPAPSSLHLRVDYLCQGHSVYRCEHTKSNLSCILLYLCSMV